MTADDIVAVLDNIRDKHWVCRYSALHHSLWWEWIAPCVLTKEPKRQISRQWYVGVAERESVLRTAFAAAKMAEEHECAEHFLYNGFRVFDPHKAVL